MSPRPLQILERLPPELRARRWIGLATAPEEGQQESSLRGANLPAPVRPGAESRLGSGAASVGELVLPWGIEALDALLPEGGLPRGAVVEVSVHGAASLATTLALKACRAAQRRGAWCGFVDPSATLHAPGTGGLGVALERLVVVRPPLEMLSRVTLRMAESRALSLVVVDALGTPEQPLDIHLGPWVRVVRRLTQALQGTESSVLLLTDKSAPRPLALPVTQRLELHRKNERELSLAVTRNLRGPLLPPRALAVADLLERPQGTGPGLTVSKPGASNSGASKPRGLAGAA